MPGVILDPERGVNPGMMNCFYCNEPKGVILWGQLNAKQKKAMQEAGIKDRIDGDAPRHIILDKEPCDKCKGFMEQGIILISVREPKNEEEQTNPYRTGGWCVVTEEAVKRWGIQPKTLLADILKRRVSFLPDDAWDMIGLPRGEVPAADAAGDPAAQ